jgi:hypothetical protein
MKKLLALTAVGLFAAASVNASAAPLGGLVPPHGLKPDAPVLSGVARLRPAVYDSLRGWQTSHLPRWQAQLGGNTYYLVFPGKGNLEELVEKRRDVWWWKIRGRVEQRRFVLGRQSARPGDPVVQDALLVSLTVLVVEGLETTPLESIRPAESGRVSVRATVKWYGNAYGRMPDGSIIGTLKGYPWEGCYIELDGRKVRLQGLPGDRVTQQNYDGQTLVLVGRLERREGDRQVPPDVLVVESFQRA